MLREFKNDESGATAIEYGLLAALIAVGLIAGATAFGDQLNAIFDSAAGTVKDGGDTTAANAL